MPEPELELIRADERRDLPLRYVQVCNAAILATGCTTTEAQAVVDRMVVTGHHATSWAELGQVFHKLLAEVRETRQLLDAVLDPRD